MPRIFKGTETLLKLFVPRVDEGNLETLKIGLFTDDTNNAAEFYGDNMTIDGDTVYLKVNAWSFDGMNDGVLNYIAEIEIGEETIITERQSNYYLKTPNQYVPVGPDVDLSNYYTKPEIDEMLEDIDSGVYVLEYVGEYSEMVEENNWNAVTNHVYAGSERQEHNAEVYKAFKEGKIKAIYYKHPISTFVEYGKTIDYQLVPCTVCDRDIWLDENESLEKVLQVTSLYKTTIGADTDDIYSTFFYLKEDGSLLGEYKENYGMRRDLVGFEQVDSHRDYKLSLNLPTWMLNGEFQLYKVIMANGAERQEVIVSFMINGSLYGEGGTFTVYGTMTDGSLIKWVFEGSQGNITTIFAVPQIISMGGDLSSYYTKTEIDTMIGDINNILETI